MASSSSSSIRDMPTTSLVRNYTSRYYHDLMSNDQWHDDTVRLMCELLHAHAHAHAYWHAHDHWHDHWHVWLVICLHDDFNFHINPTDFDFHINNNNNNIIFTLLCRSSSGVFISDTGHYLVLFRLDTIMAFANPWFRDEADAPFSLWRRRLFDDEFVPRTAASIATTISAKKERMLSNFIEAVMWLWCDANGRYGLFVWWFIPWGWMDDD